MTARATRRSRGRPTSRRRRASTTAAPRRSAPRRPPAAPVDEHSIELTGLSPGTTYSYRVSSADAAGNAAQSALDARSPLPPAGWSTAAPPTSPRARAPARTSAAASTAPTARSSSRRRSARSSTGLTLPAGWTRRATGTRAARPPRTSARSTPTAPSRTRPTSRRAARAWSSRPRSGRSTTRASASPTTSATTRWPRSPRGNSGDPFGVYASSGSRTATTCATRALPGVSLNTPHRFRIEWRPTTVTFYVDGNLVATHTSTIDAEMRPIISDYGTFGAGVRVHWLRQGPYGASGTFTSRSLDGGPGARVWGTLTATTDLPTGTAISYQTRSGGTKRARRELVGMAGRRRRRRDQLARRALHPVPRDAERQRPALADPAARLDQLHGRHQRRARRRAPSTLAPATADDRTSSLTASVERLQRPRRRPAHLPLPLAAQRHARSPARPARRSTSPRPATATAATRCASRSTPPTAAAPPATPPSRSLDGRQHRPDRRHRRDRAVARRRPTTSCARCRTGFADVDGDALTYRYQWLRNGTAIPGATNRTLDLSVAGNGDLGDQIAVDVTARDGNGGTSPVGAAHQDDHRHQLGAGRRHRRAVTGDAAGPTRRSPRRRAASASPTARPSPTPTAGCATARAISGATGSTLDLARGRPRRPRRQDPRRGHRPRPAAAPRAKRRRPTPPLPTARRAPGTVTVKPDGARPPTTSCSASVSGFTDADGDALTYQYQWFRNGTAISGATGPQPRPLRSPATATSDDQIAVDVTALDGHGGTSTAARGEHHDHARTRSNPVASFGFEEAAGAVAVNETGADRRRRSTARRARTAAASAARSSSTATTTSSPSRRPGAGLTTGMTLEAWVRPDQATNWRTRACFKEADGRAWRTSSTPTAPPNDPERARRHLERRPRHRGRRRARSRTSGPTSRRPTTATCCASTSTASRSRLARLPGRAARRRRPADDRRQPALGRALLRA